MSREELYLSEAWFECRDEDVRCQRRKMVTTRKPSLCAGVYGEPHEKPAGSRMLVERAIFEGNWASWRLCTDCMDEWLRKIGELPDAAEAAEVPE